MTTFIITFAGAKTSPLPFLDALTEVEKIKQRAMSQQNTGTQAVVIDVISNGVFDGSVEITLPSVHAAIDTPEWEKQWSNWENVFDQAILFTVSQR